MLKRTLKAICALGLTIVVAGCTLTSPGNTTASGGTLNLYGTDPTTLDPAVAGESTSIEYILQIFGGLLTLDSNLDPVADIAQTWEISPDGKTYTFHLRPDARFQDGRQVTAQDFKYSWERACSPATGSATASTYLGDIVGANDMLAGKASSLSGVTVVNDSTLQVQISAPKSYFLYKLTYPVSFVVDQNNVKSGGEWWRKPNGTGPFKLKEWTPGSQLVLERNSRFYGKMASIGSAVYHMLSGVPMNLYEQGSIDATGVSADYIDKVTDPAGAFKDQLTITPELSFYFIGFNVAEAPFDDPDIRRAFTMAIDKSKIVDLVFKGTQTVAYGIVPPGIPGYSENVHGIQFDPAGAKQLIAGSKYGDVSKLPPVTLTTAGEGGGAGWLQALVYQWKTNLGVDVTIRQLQPEIYYYSLKQEKDEMYDMGWIADYPHQQDFLELLFHTGSDINYGEYSNPAVDSILDQAGAEPSAGKSVSLYQQAEQMLVDDAACLPLWFGRSYTLVKPYVKGYVPSPLGFVMLNNVSIQK